METVEVTPAQAEAINKAPAQADPRPKGHPRFRVGELMPFKGVWFTIKEISKDGIVLEAKGFTKKGAAL